MEAVQSIGMDDPGEGMIAEAEFLFSKRRSSDASQRLA